MSNNFVVQNAISKNMGSLNLLEYNIGGEIYYIPAIKSKTNNTFSPSLNLSGRQISARDTYSNYYVYIQFTSVIPMNSGLDKNSIIKDFTSVINNRPKDFIVEGSPGAYTGYIRYHDVNGPGYKIAVNTDFCLQTIADPNGNLIPPKKITMGIYVENHQSNHSDNQSCVTTSTAFHKYVVVEDGQGLNYRIKNNNNYPITVTGYISIYSV